MGTPVLTRHFVYTARRQRRFPLLRDLPSDVSLQVLPLQIFGQRFSVTAPDVLFLGQQQR